MWAQPSQMTKFDPDLILPYHHGLRPSTAMVASMMRLPAKPGYLPPLSHNPLVMMPNFKASGCPPPLTDRIFPHAFVTDRDGFLSNAGDSGFQQDIGDLFA